MVLVKVLINKSAKTNENKHGCAKDMLIQQVMKQKARLESILTHDANSVHDGSS